jgi:L-threonylcarbamoyladenylate synthase
MRRTITTAILPTHTPALFQAAVRQAAEALRGGDVVALPTETVYGLAANALDAKAVARIYRAKGRPMHNPLIVHVASVPMARRCVREWPARAGTLAHAFWPGPLTLVLPKSDAIPGIVTAGGPTVGVRWPSHPVIQAVIRECGFPLAAPSANLAGRISPTLARHVREQVGQRIRFIVDGGPSQVGIESTVLDLTTTPPTILRPGMIHAASLAAVLAEMPGAEDAARPEKQILRSPGRLRKHYAPRAKVLVLRWRDVADLKLQINRFKFAPTSAHVVAHTRIPAAAGFAGVSVLPHDAAAYARALYAEWHRCDAAGAAVIVMEALPESPAWNGLADRLRRAAA